MRTLHGILFVIFRPICNAAARLYYYCKQNYNDGLYAYDYKKKHKNKKIKPEMVDNICDFIIKTVQTKSIDSGFQYFVSFEYIEDSFDIVMDKDNISTIQDALYEREEIAEVEIDNTDDSFDVLLFTNFAPNYDSEED